jgi:molybdenum cofactor sulfurtransferase
MSTRNDVEAFVSFVRESYTEEGTSSPNVDSFITSQTPANLLVESLTVYPIKSCGGFNISPNISWEVRPEGLAWDREWCLVHRGTGQALSQNCHPLMALIQPSLDFHRGLLCVSYRGKPPVGLPREISVPLSANPALYSSTTGNKLVSSRVCGDKILAQTYAKKEVNEFFTAVLGVPCALARFPAGGSGFSMRHSKARLQKHQRQTNTLNGSPVPGAFPSPPTPPDSDSEAQKRPILLSNESPILAISRSSLNSLNEMIVKNGGKPATPQFSERTSCLPLRALNMNNLIVKITGPPYALASRAFRCWDHVADAI